MIYLTISMTFEYFLSILHLLIWVLGLLSIYLRRVGCAAACVGLSG